MLDAEEILRRINAMPIEELAEMMKKTFEESHIPYTIKEDGQIWSDIFTDEDETE